MSSRFQHRTWQVRATVMVSAMAATLSLGWLAAQAAPQKSPAPAKKAAANVTAAELYGAHCATCHGATGQGNGTAAEYVYPKPRDFTTGPFRFKSTRGELPPTTQDVQRIIRVGVPRTAMPAFEQVLSAEQIAAIADHVISLGPKAEAADAPAAPFSVAAQPKLDAKLAAQGQKVYAALGCGACHGETGRGDGPSSNTLKDALGYALPPADFTTGVYKAGRSDEDLYRTIALGVPGTPMPAFESMLSERPAIEGLEANTNVIWAIVAYLRSLEVKREPAGDAAGAKIAAQRIDVAALQDPMHAAWNDVPATAVAIQPIWQRRQAPRSVLVRAARQNGQLALLLEWPDATVDGSAASVDGFSDAAGVLFSLTHEPIALTMGPGRSADSLPTTNIWQWRADRQMNAAAGDVQDTAADREKPADFYVGKRGKPADGPLGEHDALNVPAWREGNPKSDPALLALPVLESNAAGFGTLTLQPAQAQHVKGRGLHAHGSWRVLLTRTLTPAEDRDVNLDVNKPIPFALAIWDGSAGDRNGTKLVSGWHWLVVEADQTQAAKDRSR